LLGYAFGGGLPGLVTGAKLFLPLWLIGAALSMWIRVTQASSASLAFRRSSLASCGGSFPDRRGAD